MDVARKSHRILYLALFNIDMPYGSMISLRFAPFHFHFTILVYLFSPIHSHVRVVLYVSMLNRRRK